MSNHPKTFKCPNCGEELTEQFRKIFLAYIEEIRGNFLDHIEKNGFAWDKTFSAGIEGKAACDKCGAISGLNIIEINFRAGLNDYRYKGH